MKTKYFLIYVFVGIAFLAVSAWVFFTRGKNAKAIRAKYKLGGIMLTCLAMLSVASCGEILDPGEVTCYDPVIEETGENLIVMTIVDANASTQNGQVSRTAVFTVSIRVPTYEKYVFRIVMKNADETELYRTVMEIENPSENSVFQIRLSEDLTYKGEAIVKVQGIVQENPEDLSKMAYAVRTITII